MVLISKLNFKEHISQKIDKLNNTDSIIRKLRSFPLRSLLLTLCKSFIRPHYDHGDVIGDQPYNLSFIQKIECIQYNAAFVVTVGIKCSYNAAFVVTVAIKCLCNAAFVVTVAIKCLYNAAFVVTVAIKYSYNAAFVVTIAIKYSYNAAFVVTVAIKCSYNGAFLVTVAIKCSSREKLYQELGL